MTRLCNFYARLVWGCLCWLSVSAHAGKLPSDWRREQSFDVSTNGLVKISLPTETLDGARPALEDLRLYDDAGSEVSYLIERPGPVAMAVQEVRSFQVALNANTTVLNLETGLTQPLNGITLETPATGFIKAVQIEASADGSHWQLLAQGRPIFRQAYGASELYLSVPAGVWRRLRLTVDDRRMPPIPFTGARVHAVAGEPAPMEWLPVRVSERDENPGETRLALDLGAGNLDLAAMEVDTTEPLFMRQVSLAIPQISETSLQELTIGQGVIYRVDVEGQTPSASLFVGLEKLVRSREMLMFIRNGDSAPLAISGVRVARHPVYLTFFARQPGSYHLLAGNLHCLAPHYDLAALGLNLKNVVISSLKLPPPSDNPDYRPPEALPGLDVTGAPLDISDWKFRKQLKIFNPGAQQIELDSDVLAHAQPDFADLRIVSGSNQVPFIIQRTSIARALTPAVTVTNDEAHGRLSRWVLKLPQKGSPLTRLTCASPTRLFDRSLTLYENLTDERGEIRHVMGNGSWRQTPDHPAPDFFLALDGTMQTDTLFLETENGDNPPIELEKFQMFYPATRLLLKTKPGDNIFLYYGNPRVASPHYDLNLVAGQLLGAEKSTATLSAEEQLKKTLLPEKQTPGRDGVFFWGILAVVVSVLLIIISRLLPNTSPPAKM